MGDNAAQPGPGARWRPAGWRDPRLVVGIVLVIVSVLGVVLLVRSLDRTEPAYAASRDLMVGEELQPSDVKVVAVRLGESASQYVDAKQPLSPGSKLSVPLRVGELLSKSAVAASNDERRPLTIELSGAVPAGVKVGGRVDVYVSPTSSSTGATGVTDAEATPRLALAGLEVAKITERKDGLGSRPGVVIEVLVAPDEVPALLATRTDAVRVDVVAGALP